MFANFAGLASLPARAKVDPKDIPPPTPIILPRYQPFAQDDAAIKPADALPSLLTFTGRPNAALGSLSINALGVDLALDVKPEEIIPDPSYVPAFDQWDQLSVDEAREQNPSTRVPLRNGNLSPGCQLYVERKKELCTPNEDAFRTVRRIQPPKGKQQARLGNTYEFFRCLELFTTYWDDPTQPSPLPPSPELSTTADAERTADSKPEGPGEEPTSDVVRTASGQNMPGEFRQNLITAFIKLVAYDFGCNVSMARVEPRLHLSSPQGGPQRRKSYTPSNCSFIFQSPTTREAARAGMVYGPIAAVSARGVLNLATPDIETAQSQDLAREVVAALITAQHRAREGKTETRFGEGEWWTSKPRWGGGTGGPIGREIEKDAVPGDKDAKVDQGDGMSAPAPKKARKTMSIYDNYRMIRTPASTWDRKARYEAIGKVRGAVYDDIFVVSSLFHHVSVLRVRVPQRLLDVLDGAPEPDPARRSWGKVQAWRSSWYDLFDAKQRIAALQLMWSVMAFQMRKDTSTDDVKMTDA
ncbi:hypothetical protein S40285_08908 [Stachybotrys chlorohalonatus IBT 40285]|uniref:Uncharacterized protein n=1 Tax=Stachybotrys chlorohalonatus (strain IBT 40285) TaxID=1283841 RepID=A0A084Q9F5_STAC4|nr:hypothetical protein S40285_08908 [Stachybotrys chlorohalonata IBT 40285]